MVKRTVVFWIGLVLLLLGGAMLAFAQGTWGTVVALAGLGLVVWGALTKPVP